MTISEDFVALIDLAETRGLPKLRRDTAIMNESGWDFRVLHAQDAAGTWWILRIPRRPEVGDRVAAEAAVLDLVAPLLPIQVPRWLSADRTLIAYQSLPGRPAGAEDEVALRYQWRDESLSNLGRYAETLAVALAVLHSIPVGDAIFSAIEQRDHEWPRCAANRTLTQAEATLPLPSAWSRYWRWWLEDDRYWRVELRLTHGDVHPGHTLVTAAGSDRGSVTGLLDWTNAGLDDIAADFVDPYLAGGEDLLDRLLTGYRRAGGTELAGIRARVQLRASLRWAHVALLGAKTGRPALTRAALARLALPPPAQLPDPAE